MAGDSQRESASDTRPTVHASGGDRVATSKTDGTAWYTDITRDKTGGMNNTLPDDIEQLKALLIAQQAVKRCFPVSARVDMLGARCDMGSPATGRCNYGYGIFSLLPICHDV